MTALSNIGGFGSMLIGAKKQGYRILGNIETRPYYFGEIFEKNFNAPHYSSYEEYKKENSEYPDLIIGHTDCGSYSTLSTTKKFNRYIEQDKKDTMDFIIPIKELRPKFFVLDNLPGILELFPASYWHEHLPEYDIHFEWISNYHYGNTQKNRKRVFVIGSLRELGYFFVPNEHHHSTTVWDVIKDLPQDSDIPEIHHVHKKDDDIVIEYSRHRIDIDLKNTLEENKKNPFITYREFKEFLKKNKVGALLKYRNHKDEVRQRPGFRVIDIHKHSPVLTGGMGMGSDNSYKSTNLLPFTLRERLRIQGAPDDFNLYPVDLSEDEESYRKLVRQTAKFMPVNFTTFLTQDIKDFLEGTRDISKYSKKRCIPNNHFIDRAKREFCKETGYSNLNKVCKFCSLKDDCTSEKRMLQIWGGTQ